MATEHKETHDDSQRIPPSRIHITSDAVFKSVFGSPGSEDILASLLNSLLAHDVDTPFRDMTFISQEYPAPAPGAKSCRMDIVAMDRAGRVVDVESQRYRDDRYVERLTVYVSHLVTCYTPRGKELKLRKVICLSLGEYPLPGMEGCEAPVVRLRTTSDQPGYDPKGDLPLTVHVNLSQVRRLCARKEAKDFDAWEKWCYYLAMGGGTMANDEEFRKVKEIVESDPMVQEAYRRYLESVGGGNPALTLGLLRNWYHEDQRAGEIATAKVDGEREGKLSTARAMKEKGLDLALIAECTGLDRQAVEAL